MEHALLTQDRVRTAASSQSEPMDAAAELIRQFGDVDAAAILFFTSPALPGAPVALRLTEAYPGVPVVGCTTAGEFTERGNANGGISAVALPRALVTRAAAALAQLDEEVDTAVADAFGDVERALQVSLRDVDPARYIGLVLIDGLNGDEERVNEVLGNHAPMLSFVGGSAGDDLRFERTDVFCGADSSIRGAVLLVLEMAVPFTIVKSCSFEPTARAFTITKADAASRTVWELDHRPAAEAYAEAVGCAVADLDPSVFMSHPLGLMIDDEPWIRSPMQLVDGRGIRFYCQILPGMDVSLMRSTDLVRETRDAFNRAKDQLGGRPSGAIVFNCILRRLEIDEKNLAAGFISALGDMPVAGFHTYGESWLGHINQTVTGLVFGR